MIKKNLVNVVSERPLSLFFNFPLDLFHAMTGVGDGWAGQSGQLPTQVLAD